jgi:hypothetical protein
MKHEMMMVLMRQWGGKGWNEQKRMQDEKTANRKPRNEGQRKIV